MKSVARMMLSISSFSGVLICYFLARGDSMLMGWLVGMFTKNEGLIYTLDKMLIIGLFIALAIVSIRFSIKYFSNTGGFNMLESRPLESVAIPTYVGLFVIAIEIAGMNINGEVYSWLSFKDVSATILLLLLFILWRRIEKIIYFNPVWLVGGYRFYEIRAADGNSYTLITKRDDMKIAKEPIKLDSLIRINNYTFMEAETQ